MKTKLPLLIIFLLATGGAAFGQQVLIICSSQTPCGLPIGTVQAVIDANGWRNFKLTLTQNVTSFNLVGIPPPTQASVNVIFTQDATGGRTVTFASNITNPCTVTATANATTLCQFEYDGVAGVWIGVTAGGATVTAASGTNVTTQGVATSNTATQNQTAFAAIATAVNAGTLSPYIYIPAGTYNILTTGSSGLGTYSQTGLIHCENPSTTILNFSGTGQVATIGKTGLTTSSAYIWTPFVIENCQFTGGANLTEGILIPPENWGAEIRYNYFTNFGNATMFAVHGQQDTWFKLIGNNYYRNDGVLGKIAYLGPTASPSVYGLLEAYYNKVVCAISATNANTTPCGVGFASELYLIAQHNVMSGPVPLIRCGTGVGSSTPSASLSCQINDNILEIFGTSTFGVQFGTPGAGSAEGVFGMLVTNNHVYTSTGDGFIGPASVNTGLANSTVSGNILRHDSLGSGPMVTLNNLTAQAGNTASNNQGFPNPLHTHGTNISAWTLSSNAEVEGCSEESSAAGIDAGQCLFRSTSTNLYSIINIVPNGTGASNLTSGLTLFNTDYTASQTNYENFQMLWNTNKMTININKAGTGTLRALGIQYNGTDRFAFDASGNPFLKTGTSGNTDLAGQLTLSGGTASFTFLETYLTAPICVATDTTAANAVKVTTSTTTLTLTGTTTDVINYMCSGRT